MSSPGLQDNSKLGATAIVGSSSFASTIIWLISVQPFAPVAITVYIPPVFTVGLLNPAVKAIPDGSIQVKLVLLFIVGSSAVKVTVLFGSQKIVPDVKFISGVAKSHSGPTVPVATHIFILSVAVTVYGPLSLNSSRINILPGTTFPLGSVHTKVTSGFAIIS